MYHPDDVSRRQKLFATTVACVMHVELCAPTLGYNPARLALWLAPLLGWRSATLTPTWFTLVRPAIAGLTWRTEVDMNELRFWVLANAHTTAVKTVCKFVELAHRDALNPDIHGRGMEMPAALVALKSETGGELNALSSEMVLNDREHFIEPGVDRAGFLGALATKHVV